MASVITDASISTSTDSNLKRTPPSTMQSAREGSPQKRPKRETKLDRLKAKLKSEATLLKKLVEGELEIVKDTGVVKEPVLLYYCDLCDHILAGEELVESDLTIFKKPFAANFVGENILREKLSPEEMDFHEGNLCHISRLLTNIITLTETVQAETQGLPEPSAYAQHKIWSVWQEKATAILNLRPPTKEGLPIEVLHPAFASFLHDVRSMPPDEWAQGHEANPVSLALCQAMARKFDNEQKRRIKLTELLRRLGLDLQTEHHIEQTLPHERHSVQPGLYLSASGKMVLLGEIKSEFETGDPYMQVSRSYQALIHHLRNQNQVSDGVPCIVLVVCGPLLTVAAGFYDGTHIIVEPLTDGYMTLPSRYMRREKRLAQVLSFMQRVIQTLSQPSQQLPLNIPPNTPRIYPTYTDSLGNPFKLEFISLLGDSSLHLNPRLLFTAKHPTISTTMLLVKLVDPTCYSEEVHRTLAKEGLAPLLHGTAHVTGAPSAIVMEYLDPSSGWTTLQDYIREHREVKITTEHLALTKLLRTMKEKKVVHGDLRPNNIMCRAPPDGGTEGQALEIKVVDFDWAGMLGSTKYPAIMNPSIKWPGEPHGFISEGDDETLLAQTLAMV